MTIPARNRVYIALRPHGAWAATSDPAELLVLIRRPRTASVKTPGSSSR